MSQLAIGFGVDWSPDAISVSPLSVGVSFGSCIICLQWALGSFFIFLGHLVCWLNRPVACSAKDGLFTDYKALNNSVMVVSYVYFSMCRLIFNPDQDKLQLGYSSRGIFVKRLEI